MILRNNHCYYSLVTSLGCLFHKQVRYVEQQNVTSSENVSMLSAGLKIFVLEEKLNSREMSGSKKKKLTRTRTTFPP